VVVHDDAAASRRRTRAERSTTERRLAPAATEHLLWDAAVVEVVEVSTQRDDRARDRRPPLRLTGRHRGE